MRKSIIPRKKAIEKIGIKNAFNFFIRENPQKRYFNFIFKSNKLQDFLDKKVIKNENNMASIFGLHV